MENFCIIIIQFKREFNLVAKHLKVGYKISAPPRFFNPLSVFGYLMKHSSLCLIYLTLETDVLNYAAKYKLRFKLSFT